MNDLVSGYSKFREEIYPVHKTLFKGLDSGQSPETLPQGQLLRPFPQFRDVFAHHFTAARSRYDSVRIELEKRFRGNWGARVNYTWSRQRDNVYEDNGGISDESRVVFNNSDIDGGYGLSRLDVPHTLNLNGLYRLPSPDGGTREVLLGVGPFQAPPSFDRDFR